MKREEIKEKLYNKYIRPTLEERPLNIGIEIEMPVVNLSGTAADHAIAQAAAAAARKEFGFHEDRRDENGICYSATRPDNGDNLSFDCSYNNLEISFGKERDLNILDRRFRQYTGFLNEELGRTDHILTGMGTNPGFQVNRSDFIPCERYRMLERYLLKSRVWNVPMYFHPYPGFAAFASASQVQLDVHGSRLIPTITAQSLLEPLKAVLFSNSLLPSEPDLLCVRDLFWENSTHGINPHNIGMYESRMDSIDDLLEYICTTSIFCTERDGRYINFLPVPITDYLEADQISGEYYQDGTYHPIVFHPEAEDLAYLRTYKFEDLTFRGTLEYRSSCCQPFRDAMTVAAFHLGLHECPEQVIEIMREDHSIYHHGFSCGELRRIMNRRSWPEFVDRKGLRRLLLQVLDLADRNLRGRGLGEEKYLLPLYDRADTLTSPGRVAADALDRGETMRTMTLQYARPD